MSRRLLSYRVPAALGLAATLLLACDEDGKTAPAKCSEPELKNIDPSAGAPGGNVTEGDCLTPVGHATSPPSVDAAATTSGSSNGGSSGSANGGSSGSANGATGGAEAGAGGA